MASDYRPREFELHAQVGAWTDRRKAALVEFSTMLGCLLVVVAFVMTQVGQGISESWQTVAAAFPRY